MKIIIDGEIIGVLQRAIIVKAGYSSEGLGHHFGHPGSVGILPATGRRPVNGGAEAWRDHLGQNDDQGLILFWQKRL